MIARPNLPTLNYVRSKDPKHAEALDALITAIGNQPGFVDMQPLSGTVNGVNTVFFLPSSPNPASSLHLYKTTAGATLLLVQGTDYALSGRQVTMKTAPASGSVLLGSYRI